MGAWGPLRRKAPQALRDPYRRTAQRATRSGKRPCLYTGYIDSIYPV